MRLGAAGSPPVLPPVSVPITPRPRVAFLVNGGPNSAMGDRARAFAQRLSDRFDIAITYRTSSRARSIGDFLSAVRRQRPRICYVFDLAYAGVIAGVIARMTMGTKLVIDTGDAIYELAKSVGMRGPVGLAMTWLLERGALRLADGIVVRGTYHQTLLASRGRDAVVVQDGIDASAYSSPDSAAVRRRLGLEGVLGVGVLGSLVWSDRLQMGYGWDLVEAIRLLKGEPVKGVVIGAGTAVPILKSRVASYGIADQVTFLEPVPLADVPTYLSAVDVWLSTQTNDIPGNVRTTGKLPLYMAAGRYILATDVGEAALVLPPEMRVEYNGVYDTDYPSRLAERLRALIADPGRLAAGAHNVDVAKRQFDYDVLAERVAGVLASLSSRPVSVAAPPVLGDPGHRIG